MAAYRRVYAGWLPRTGINSGILRSVVDYIYFTSPYRQHHIIHYVTVKRHTETIARVKTVYYKTKKTKSLLNTEDCNFALKTSSSFNKNWMNVTEASCKTNKINIAKMCLVYFAQNAAGQAWQIKKEKNQIQHYGLPLPFFRAAITSRDIFVCGMLCASLEPRAGVAQWNRYNTARALRRWQRCALKAAPAAQNRNGRVCGRKRPHWGLRLDASRLSAGVRTTVRRRNTVSLFHRSAYLLPRQWKSRQ